MHRCHSNDSNVSSTHPQPYHDHAHDTHQKNSLSVPGKTHGRESPSVKTSTKVVDVPHNWNHQIISPVTTPNATWCHRRTRQVERSRPTAKTKWRSRKKEKDVQRRKREKRKGEGKWKLVVSSLKTLYTLKRVGYFRSAAKVSRFDTYRWTTVAINLTKDATRPCAWRTRNEVRLTHGENENDATQLHHPCSGWLKTIISNKRYRERVYYPYGINDNLRETHEHVWNRTQTTNMHEVSKMTKK